MLFRRLFAAASLLALVAIGGACFKSLDSLAPFPCAKDGSCPDNFTCSTNEPRLCFPTIECGARMTECNGVCTVTNGDDVQNCGGCGQACGPDQVCCSGECSTLSEDANNCSMCGNACTHAKSCINGTCQCQPSQKECDGSCTDTSSDHYNCGGCGKKCSPGFTCDSGHCMCQIAVEDPTNCPMPGFPYYCGTPGCDCFDKPVACVTLAQCANGCRACLSCGQLVDCSSPTPVCN